PLDADRPAGAEPDGRVAELEPSQVPVGRAVGREAHLEGVADAARQPSSGAQVLAERTAEAQRVEVTDSGAGLRRGAAARGRRGVDAADLGRRPQPHADVFGEDAPEPAAEDLDAPAARTVVLVDQAVVARRNRLLPRRALRSRCAAEAADGRLPDVERVDVDL